MGNAFSNGEFTCSVTGLYFISGAIEALDVETWISVRLYKESTGKFKIRFYNDDNGNFNIGLVHCNKGEIIKLTLTLGSGDASLYGGEAVTTLTVFLVQETGIWKIIILSYFSNDILFI